MPKRQLILGILALGMVTALVILVSHPREPSYEGYRLGDLLEFLGGPGARLPADDAKAFNAIRQIGPKAIPFLVTWVQYEPTTVGKKIDSLLANVGIHIDFTRRRADRAGGAVRALADLGRNNDLGQSPAFAPLTNSTNHGPLTQGRLSWLREELRKVDPVPELHDTFAKPHPELLTNAPPVSTASALPDRGL